MSGGTTRRPHLEPTVRIPRLIAWGWAFERAGLVQIAGSGIYHMGGWRGGMLGEV
jgi:hypothetical protein